MGGNGESESGLGVTRQGNVFYGADKLVTAWVAKRIPGFQDKGETRALGIIAGGKMAGGVVYEDYNGLNIQASIAGEPGVNWLTRDTLHQIFAYPFIGLNCTCITVLCAMTNAPSIRLATKMGFEGEAIVRFAAHDGSDLVVLKMFRDQCRWIRHEQQGQPTGGS